MGLTQLKQLPNVHASVENAVYYETISIYSLPALDTVFILVIKPVC